MMNENNSFQSFINKIATENKILLNEKQTLTEYIKELKSNEASIQKQFQISSNFSNIPVCTCDDKFKKEKSKLNAEILKLSKALNEKNILIQIDQQINFNQNKNSQCVGKKILEKNENSSLDLDSKYLQIFQKYSDCLIIIQEKETSIYKLKEEINRLENKLQELNLVIRKQDEEMKNLESSQIELNKNILIEKINCNLMTETNLEINLDNINLSKKIENSSEDNVNKNNLVLTLKNVIKNKESVIINQNKEINEMLINLKEKDKCISLIEEVKKNLIENNKKIIEEKRFLNDILVKKIQAENLKKFI